jgi:O-antigen/teichoic acid export membrane protein
VAIRRSDTRTRTAAAASLAIRAGSLALAFAAQILLARALGLAGFGIFAFALAWMKTLSIAATLGTERLLIREASGASVESGWPRLHGLIRWVRKTTLAAAAATALLAGLAFSLLLPDEAWLPTLWLALAILPLLALTRLAQHVLTGLQRPLIGQVPELILQPILFLALAAALSGQLGPASAMTLQLTASAAAAVTAAILLAKALPQAAPTPAAAHPAWRASMAAMLVVTGAIALLGAAPILLLGLIRGPEAAGAMAVARSLADAAGIPAAAFGAVLSSRLALLWARGERRAALRTLDSFARASALATAAAALALFLFRTPLLHLFGPGFETGAGALVILLGSQILSALAGSNALLLTIAGQERKVALVSAAAAGLGIALAALLIPPFGLEGAAAGASAGAILWNLALRIAARRLPPAA